MGRFRRNGLILILTAVAVLAVAIPATGQQPAKPKTWREQPLSDELVDAAMKRAIDYLWKAADANPNGEKNWEMHSLARYLAEMKEPDTRKLDHNSISGMYSGATSLVLLAMLKAGVKCEDPRFQEAFKSIVDVAPRGVYARGLRAALFSSLPSDDKGVVLKLMKQERDWLLDAIFADGTYGYYQPITREQQLKPPSSIRRDLSNTQYGVLGMWYLSDTMKMEIPVRYWQLVQAGCLANRAKDGGWGYYVGSPADVGYQSMTLGALANLFIVWDKRFTDKCDQPPDPELIKGIEGGLAWLAANFNPAVNVNKGNWFILYTLYGVERVGVASGLKYFGDKNWWDLCARYVLYTQRPDGSWAYAHDKAKEPVCTAWALLFLSYGRAPVVFNKLAYGTATQWNSRPRDLARLTVWMGKTYEKLFNWQIMPIDRPVEELLDAPILLVSGKSALQFTDQQKAKLKEYVLGGGLLLGDPADGEKAFMDSFRALGRELFGELEWARLPADHPIYTAHFRQHDRQAGWLPPPVLEGISNGIRTLMLLSHKDLGCSWQRYEISSGRPSFELAGNLMQYVSDQGSGLVGRGTSYMVRDEGRRPAKQVMVGRVVWGHKYQWDPEPYAWRRVDVTLRNADVMSVTTRECDLSEAADPKDVPLMHLTGTGELTLTDAQKANLKKYVADGGLLLVDEAGGKGGFAGSFRKLAGELFGQPEPAFPPFLAEAAPDGRMLMRHVGQLPRTTRPLDMLGYRSPAGPSGGTRWGVLLVPMDLTAALAGYPNVEPVGLAIPSAEKFIAALLKWVQAGQPPEGHPAAAASP